MDLFNVIITAKAEEQLTSYTDYIYYTLHNENAAREVILDARETQEDLAKVAASLQYCRHPVLKQRGYRSITFRRHRYVMIYLIEGENVYVEAIYHELQDYENTFSEELK